MIDPINTINVHHRDQKKVLIIACSRPLIGIPRALRVLYVTTIFNDSLHILRYVAYAYNFWLRYGPLATLRFNDFDSSVTLPIKTQPPPPVHPHSLITT